MNNLKMLKRGMTSLNTCLKSSSVVHNTLIARPTILARRTDFDRCMLRSSSSKTAYKKIIGLNNRYRYYVRAVDEDVVENDVKLNKEFGYSRKDVILIGIGLIALGYGLKFGFQAFGVDELRAGTFSQFTIFVIVLLNWVATYVLRVANKEMTYVKQLKDYEEAVMQKRLEEMTEAEMEALLKEVEEEKQALLKKIEIAKEEKKN